MEQLGMWTDNERPACFECGALSIHDHHVVPRVRGGTKTVPLCERCHGKVHGSNLKTSQLTREGLAKKKARGEYFGGTRPFGFKVEGTRLVAHPAEQEAVALILDLRRQGATLRAIVAELNTREIATKRGGRWHIQTVNKILGRASAA